MNLPSLQGSFRNPNLNASSLRAGNDAFLSHLCKKRFWRIPKLILNAPPPFKHQAFGHDEDFGRSDVRFRILEKVKKPLYLQWLFYFYSMKVTPKQLAVFKAGQVRNRRKKYVRYALYILGVIGGGYCLREYNNVFINGYILFGVHIVAGFLLATAFERSYKEYVFATLCFGGLFSGTIMLYNSFTNATPVIVTLPILKKVEPYGKSRSWNIKVNYDGLSKNIPINDTLIAQLPQLNYAILTMREGRLGYYIVTDKKLKK